MKAGALKTRPIVFLHIPKTAGQTIHHALSAAVGARHVSPVRVNAQAGQGPKMPPGYRLYSGHIDWMELPSLPDPFTFTVLRDPRERIASFYFYLLKEAREGRAAPDPETGGAPPILARDADGYFCGGGPLWQRHIANHYDNFYCRYFATGRYDSAGAWEGIPPAHRLKTALTRAHSHLDRVYSVTDLAALEADLTRGLGRPVPVAERYANVGTLPRATPRWPALMAQLKSQEARDRLERYVALDAPFVAALDGRAVTPANHAPPAPSDAA